MDVRHKIDILIHVTILFGVLSMFFMFYVSKVIKNALAFQLEALVNEHMTKMLSSVVADEQEIVNALSPYSSVILQHFISNYSTEYEKMRTYNTQLFTIIILINVALIGIVVFTVFTTNSLSAADIKYILIENAIIFSCIGLIEFLFFKFIIMQYIPLPPSAMGEFVLESVKNSLTKHMTHQQQPTHV